MAKIKVVHYSNQFYAGVGGEDKADIAPFVNDGLTPLSQQFQSKLGDDFEVVATVVCGDTYFNENIESAKKELLEMIKKFEPDYFIAGPAFNAGRYGVACGAIAEAVQEELNIPAITGMYPENPGCDMYKKKVYIIETKDNAAGMRKAIKAMTAFAQKHAKKEKIGTPKEEGYIAQGKRINFFSEETGSRRAVDMLIKKLNGEEFETEYPMPVFDRVDPQPAVKDMQNARIALVTSGGVVPKGNPDKIESSSASKFGQYNLEDIEDFVPENSETAHGGYDPVYCNEDCDRVVPLDVVRKMLKEGKIGSLHPYWYATVGNGTSTANAKNYGDKIAEYLLADKVDAVILTST